MLIQMLTLNNMDGSVYFIDFVWGHYHSMVRTLTELNESKNSRRMKNSVCTARTQEKNNDYFTANNLFKKRIP